MKTQKAFESAKGKIASRNIRILIYLGVNLIIVVCLIAQGVFHEASVRTHLLLAGAITLVICIGTGIHYRTLDRTLSDPIRRLKNATEKYARHIGSGERFFADIHTDDEIEELMHSIEELDRSLQHYIQENTEITAERERLRTELELAAGIQKDMLPCFFPPFPDRSEFALYAVMEPAKEVGGDFYDFFLIDPDHLGLVIADVSGKGIPAALFMMVAKTMIQNCVLAGLTPSGALEQVNRLIAENNNESMFVTVWLGILDIPSGKLTAVNAGHEYPVVKNPDGCYELIKDKHGMAVGMIEGVHYREYELELSPGSSLFVYSDGLPEANNVEEKLFGIDRMLAALNEKTDAGPEETLKAVRSSVDAFVGEAPQFDDLTMLCLNYYGPAGRNEPYQEETDGRNEYSVEFSAGCDCQYDRETDQPENRLQTGDSV